MEPDRASLRVRRPPSRRSWLAAAATLLSVAAQNPLVAAMEAAAAAAAAAPPQICGAPAGARVDVAGYGGASARCPAAPRVGLDLRGCIALLARSRGCSALTHRPHAHAFGGGGGDGVCTLHDRFAPGFVEGPAASAAYVCAVASSWGAGERARLARVSSSACLTPLDARRSSVDRARGACCAGFGAWRLGDERTPTAAAAGSSFP